MELAQHRVGLQALGLAVSNYGIPIREGIMSKLLMKYFTKNKYTFNIKLWFTLLPNKAFENRVWGRVYEPKRTR